MRSLQYFPARSVLFRKEANGVTYRVPALIYLPHSNTFLAFCEERLSPSDAQAHLLVMRKGTFYRTYVEWEDMSVLGTAWLSGHRSMNPCPLYDEFTGTLFLFFIAVLGHTSELHQLVTGKNVTRLCFISSTDNGNSWSPTTDLTKRVIGDTIKDWATFALGPGHGIQLKSGRLLVPAYAYQIDCRECFGQVCKTTPHAFCFYSDTHGRTWHFGEAVPCPESVECQVVSVDEEDGTNVLYCNARSPLGCRVQSLSLDDGAVFQDGQLVQRLTEPHNGCHGSVVGFPAPLKLNHHLGPLACCRNWDSFTALSEDSLTATVPYPNSLQSFLIPTWVVYSHPTWANARKDLGIYLSPFPRDPDSWSGPWVIYEGPSAYSDLACMELPSAGVPPAVAFACLFECGTSTAYDEISFSIFSLYELIDNLPHNTKSAKKMQDQSDTLGLSKNQIFHNTQQLMEETPEVSKRRTRKLCGFCNIS